MNYYAVIDTNVLVSSLLTKFTDSSVVKVMKAIRNDVIVPMYNDTILLEYEEVLKKKKFGFDAGTIKEIMDLMKAKGINCSGKPVSEFFPDPTDIVFYEVTLSREDSYLITGNLKHFPKNGRVVSPADMLQIIEYGAVKTVILSEPEAPLYMRVTLEEINSIIREYRANVLANRA